MMYFPSTLTRLKAGAMHDSFPAATPLVFERQSRQWKPIPIFHIRLIYDGKRDKLTLVFRGSTIELNTRHQLYDQNRP